ncbi:MAG: phage terminase large subunit [Minisyncoccales bacterium]
MKNVYHAHEFQIQALTSQKRLIFLGCGVGSGKTETGSLFVLNKIKKQLTDQISVIAANSYTQLVDSTIRRIYQNWKKWGVNFYPRDIPTGHQPFNIYVWNGSHYVEILCRSLDAYKMLSGEELAWAWCDEVWQTKKEAVDLVISRVRDERNGMLRQILFTTTLDDPDTWMYKFCEEPEDPDIIEVHYVDSFVNEANLPKGYLNDLKSIYSPEMYKRMVLAQWVILGSGRIYSSFVRNLHEDPSVELDPQLPVIWSWDFNIGEGKPMSSALGQIRKGTFVQRDGLGNVIKTIVRPEINWFDEIVIESTDTNEAIDEFESRDWLRMLPNGKSQVQIYGDRSGKSRDTRSRTTDYGIMRSRGFVDQRVPQANPPIRERHNVVNALLMNADGDTRMKIHPRCKNILKGAETTRLKKGADYIEEETYCQHVMTAVGYACCPLFPLTYKGFTEVKIGGL